MPKEEISLKQAIAMLSKCCKSRLPLAVEILRQSGYQLSDEAIAFALNDGKNKEGENENYKWDRTPYIKARRLERLRDIKWEKTTNPAVYALRKAYMDGLRFSRIAELCTMGRKQPYRYMHGPSEPNGILSDKILEAIDQVYAEQGITKSE